MLATPYILDGLGAEEYGLMALAIATIGFLGLLDLGMGAALVKFVSQFFATRDYAGINQAVGTSLLFYGGIGLVGLALSLAGTPFFVEEILSIPAGLETTAETVFYITGFSFFFTMLLNVLASLPGSIQRFDVRAKVNMTYTTATVLLTVLLVYLGHGVREIVMLNLVLTIGGIGAYVFVGRRLLPLEPVLKPNLDLLKQMFSFGSFAFVSAASGIVLFHLDKFIIGAFMGVQMVTFYAIPASLAAKIHASVANLAQVIFPLSSELITLEQKERLHHLYVRATRLVLAFVATIAIPPLFFADEILGVWLGRAFAETSATVFVLLIVAYILLTFSIVPSYLVHGAGQPRIAALFALLSGALNVALLLFLVPRFGILGAGWAYLFSVAPVPVFVVVIERRILRASGTAWIRSVSRVVPAAVVQAVACALVLQHLVEGLASLIVSLVVGSAIFPLVYFSFRLAATEDTAMLRALWHARVSRETT